MRAEMSAPCEDFTYAWMAADICTRNLDGGNHTQDEAVRHGCYFMDHDTNAARHGLAYRNPVHGKTSRSGVACAVLCRARANLHPLESGAMHLDCGMCVCVM
jgi:hypothetical protein